MILSIFTFTHVVISLVGILSGLVLAYALINAKQLDRWTFVFLRTTVLISVTGFMFPFHEFQPPYVGAISLLVLTLALFALYRRHLEGGWRRTYVISAMIALYLNVFVLIVQLFRRVPALKALAPTQTEPTSKITQLVVLLVFVAVTVLATTKFSHAQLRTA